jgi:hypothetical protein
MTDDRRVDHFSIQQLCEVMCEGFVVMLKTGRAYPLATAPLDAAQVYL